MYTMLRRQHLFPNNELIQLFEVCFRLSSSCVCHSCCYQEFVWLPFLMSDGIQVRLFWTNGSDVCMSAYVFFVSLCTCSFSHEVELNHLCTPGLILEKVRIQVTDGCCIGASSAIVWSLVPAAQSIHSVLPRAPSFPFSRVQGCQGFCLLPFSHS